MSGSPAISVLMSVYNGERHVYAAVRSILDQDFGDFEFLIVNDGSTDNSGAILRELAASDPRIKLTENDNRGLITCLNEMIGRARAPLLARMDCDDVAMPDRFSKQFSYLAQHPEIDIIGTAMHLIDEDGAITGFNAQPSSPQAARDYLSEGPPLCHPSVMMRASLIQKIGAYRPAFRHAEDYDLWLRASRIADMTSLDEPLILYRRSDSQVSQKYQGEQAMAAAVAWHAHQHVLAGGKDPFDAVDALPAIEDMNRLFGTEDASSSIRQRLVEHMRYSPEMLNGPQFGLMLAQGRTKAGFAGAGRTVLRLVKSRQLLRALLLGFAVLAVDG